MFVASQNLLTNSNCRTSFFFTRNSFTPLKTSTVSLSSSCRCLLDPPHFQFLAIKSTIPNNFNSPRALRWPLRAYNSDSAVPKSESVDSISVDAFLSVFEFLFLASSAVVSVLIAVNPSIPSLQKPIIACFGNRIIGYQFVLLVSALIVGFAIRRRQWNRLCMGRSNSQGSGVNFLQRIEKLEEDLRSSATIIRILSRQVEKLGIRFRLTRKTLKEPIAETAALAQKNSEATRALAMQEDNLEKELGEIQKVLLAMQEQQRKQLELILAIVKSGNLWETKQGNNGQYDNKTIETRNSSAWGGGGVNQVDANQVQTTAPPRQSEEANSSSERGA